MVVDDADHGMRQAAMQGETAPDNPTAGWYLGRAFDR
jgi:hypothetical protein